ncbi:MAG TPA: OsmC family protein [Candidatus Dormibacteraeota bacterium]
MTKATARWTGNKVQFDILSDSGHTAQVDESPSLGDDAAMRPTEMLLGALGGCTGINAVLLLKKVKQPLRGLQVDVEGDRHEEWPKAFKHIQITFNCTWDGDIDKKLVEQAIDMACNRYCPIHATLSHGVKLEHRRKDHR